MAKDVVVDSSVKGVVFDLVGRSAANYNPSTTAYDCALGGLPFIFATSDKYPYQRQSIQVRKYRVDNGRDAGESSLDSGTWYRSGSSFHLGAGQRSYESLETQDAVSRFRFNRSFGVDVWTKGEAGSAYEAALASYSSAATPIVVGIPTGVAHLQGTVVKSLQDPSVGSASTTYTWSYSAVQSAAADSVRIYACDGSTVASATIGGAAAFADYATGLGAYSGTSAIVRTAKDRLFVGKGPNIWQVTAVGAVGASNSGTNPLIFTHPSSTWNWVDFAEGPSAVFVAGNGNNVSSIYNITLASSASGVTLNTPTVIAELPRGETVNCLKGYLGKYLLVGTSRGLRVAVINSDSTIQLGPLTVSGSPVYDVTCFDKFAYVGAQSVPGGVDFGVNSSDATTKVSGVVRVDLSAQLDDGTFAWAVDMVSPVSGNVTSVSTNQYGTVYFGVSGQGVFQKTLNRTAVGWLETGRIRYSTLEPKAWRTVRLMGNCPGASRIEVYAASSPTSVWSFVGQINGLNADMTASLETVCPGQQKELWLAFRFVRDEANPTYQPSLYGWQVRAVPVPIRQRLIEAAVLMFDFEQDHNGLRTGQRGGAWKRLQALESLEQSSGAILWQDFSTGESTTVTIEQVSFQRLNPPTRNFTGAGGVCQLVLRTV